MVTGRTTDNEILRKINAPNTIKPADKWLSTLLIDACHNRTDEVRTESLLVERTGDQIGHRRRRDVALLAETVHVDFIAEEIGDCGDVGGKASETQVDIAVGEDLGEVVRDGEGLETETEIAGYGNTILSDHCDASTAICGLLIDVNP